MKRMISAAVGLALMAGAAMADWAPSKPISLWIGFGAGGETDTLGRLLAKEMSDSTGWIYDPEGIDLKAIKEIKEVNRARLSEYKAFRPNSEYSTSGHVWQVKCDVALPCATQNELLLEDAKALVKNGVTVVAEGANMPSTPDAVEYLQKHGVLFAPGKAANAGGVATSCFEMSQNASHDAWTKERSIDKLFDVMHNIHEQCVEHAPTNNGVVNYGVGADRAGFIKVADAIVAMGV